MHFKDPPILKIKTVEGMMKILESKGNPLSSYKKGTRIIIFIMQIMIYTKIIYYN